MAAKFDLIKELVISFGFLNGVLFAIGVDPTREILKLVSPMIATMPEYVRIFITVLPLILTAWMIFRTYNKGGFWGIVSVCLGFVGGFLLLSLPIRAMMFLGGGLILGLFAFEKY